MTHEENLKNIVDTLGLVNTIYLLGRIVSKQDTPLVYGDANKIIQECARDVDKLFIDIEDEFFPHLT